MRFLKSCVVAVLLAAMPIGAQPANVCSTTQQVVESYLLDKHSGTKNPIRVGVYDAKTHEWQAFHWDGTNAVETKAAIETPVSNEPILFVRHGEEVAVLVLHANPLLYSGEVTKVERADIEGLAELQKLATLAGATLPNLPHVARLGLTIPPSTTQALNAEASRLEVHAFSQKSSTWKLPLKQAAAEEVIEDRRETLMLLVDNFITALDHEYGPIRQNVNDAVVKVEEAKKAGVALDGARLQVADSLQFAELGTPAVVAPGELASFSKAPDTVRKAYDAAGTAAAVLRPATPLCGDSLAALDSALSVLLDTAPADDDEKESDDKSVRTSLTKLRKSSISADCIRAGDDAPQETELTKSLLALADWLRKPDNRATAVDEEVAALLDNVRVAVASYRRAFAARTTVLEQAATVADKRAATLKLAIQMQRFAQLYNAQAVQQETHCWYSQGVVEVERTQKNALDLPRFEVQTEEFNVAVRTAFKDDVVRMLPDELKGKYTLSHGNYGLGVDTALVFTHANDREYAAVEHKDVDINGDNVVDDKDKQIIIHEKSRTQRTGKLALMLTLAPPSLHGLGAQFGLGVDSDNPSAFIGATWSIGKFARISAGHTQQRVTRLVGNQSVGGVLPAADALSTRERFDASWYAALAFTISKLSIFSTK